MVIAFVCAGALYGMYGTSAGNREAFEDKSDIVSPDTVNSPEIISTSTEASIENKNMYNATMKTNMGEIVLELYKDKAPNTVDNFVKLSNSGFYNGTKFHRVIKDFMNQGGDPLTKDDSKAAMWGTGGPGYQFADELYAGNANMAGTIAMANAGPNTNGSQFFINVVNNNFLDTKHVVFGKVIAGLDIVKKINNVATTNSDRPIEAVVVESITIK